MKSYLLDTHILLWWLSDDKKMEKRLKNLIANPTNHIVVSTASIWEIVIKKSLNKLKSPDNIKEVILANHFEIISITIDHVLYLENLPFIHHDPFDRILISQCIVDSMIMVTADTIIPNYTIECF